ncbi:MAG: hypothetical protein LBS74_09225 [Oscillospiraceae bacterium]|jgi:hypothetical protein|nr:hypothetical protein [Oscillospiraceae bacterium]
MNNTMNMDMNNSKRSGELVARRRDLAGIAAGSHNTTEFTAQDNARVLASINRERHPATAFLSALKHVLLILTVLYVIFFLVAVIKANAKSSYTSENRADNPTSVSQGFDGYSV